jgi:hypothetical protein
MQETNYYSLELEDGIIEVEVVSTYEIKESREQHPYGDGYAYEHCAEIEEIEHEIVSLDYYGDNGWDESHKGEEAEKQFNLLSKNARDEIIANIESELGQ